LRQPPLQTEPCVCSGGWAPITLREA